MPATVKGADQMPLHGVSFANALDDAGLAAAALALTVGTLLGSAAGYFGRVGSGWIFTMSGDRSIRARSRASR